MDKNVFRAENLVFDKYMAYADGHFSFGSELKLMIDENHISIQDALNIILELMYDVIIYNYDEGDVDEEFKSLTEKVKGYNIEKQDSIKNAVLFFKDYSHEKELFMMFSSNLNIDPKYKNEIEGVFDNGGFTKDSDDSVEVHDAKPVKDSQNNEDDAKSVKDSQENEDDAKPVKDSQNNEDKSDSISLSVRERMELDEEIRKLSKQIRKRNPYYWREILKKTPAYKKRHGLEMDNENKSDSIQNEDADFKGKDKPDFPKTNNDDESLENESSKIPSGKELKRLKTRSDYLSNKINYTIKDYSNFIKEITSELERIDDEFIDDDMKKMFADLELTYNDLKDCKRNCNDFKLLDAISKKINDADEDLKNKKSHFKQRLFDLKRWEFESVAKKLDEYNRLKAKAQSMLEDELIIFSRLNSILDELVGNSNELGDTVDKRELLDNLGNVRADFKKQSNNFDIIRNNLKNKDFDYFVNIGQAKNEIAILKRLIDQLDQVDLSYLEESLIEQDELYQELLSLSEKIRSRNVENSLKEFEKCFNRPRVKRQVKRYNLRDNELDLISEGIRNDIIEGRIAGDSNFKKILLARCGEFKIANSGSDEEGLDELLDNVDFPGINEDIVEECKNKVKEDYSKGNITINQAELKLRNYVNKKMKESMQLEELGVIRSDPYVPNIALHLTQEENDEIYAIVEMEILSEEGVNDVESRVFFWTNKKIRENQSEARGRLNIIKRNFSNSTQLNKEEQVEFIHQIEYCINNHQIKYYDITEEYIIELSEVFIRKGEIRLG